MEIFGVRVNRDDTVRVVSVDVVRETPQFFLVEWPASDDRYAFSYSKRIDKGSAHTTARSALETYMSMRQRDKENAKAVIAQATKQIASANEALMHLSDPPEALKDGTLAQLPRNDR